VQRVRGREDGQAAWLLNELGNYLFAVGSYAEAQPLRERALAIWEAVLGADYPDTATGLNNLASLLEVQGDYERALPLYERALRIREDRLGPQHPRTQAARLRLPEHGLAGEGQGG
jgi:tetratricopeptide (TPR) repeat protein